MTVVFAILPIFLTMLCGYVLARGQALTREGWTGVETLSFRLLIPVMLVRAIALSELSLSEFGGMLTAILITLSIAGAAVFGLRALRGAARLPNPDFSTLFQTTTRWNAFMSLAAAEMLAGAQALLLIAAAMAVLVPLINIANLIVLARYGSATPSLRGMAVTLARNPLVLACALGLAINLSGLPLPTPIIATLDLIGRAALGIGLLAVGAAMRPERLIHLSPQIIAGVLLRLALCPALFLICASALRLGPLEIFTGLLMLAVPTATNGYIVAKQMGGNSDLYADILTWQMLVCMGILPLLLAAFPAG